MPYLPRPVNPADGDAWRRWLVTDQRFVDGRPDVLTYVTPALTEALRISGPPVVNLVASTSGTDSDWVVKLIDVYPDEVPSQPEMSGYELNIAMDIFRGRYRESFEGAKSDRAEYTVDLQICFADGESRFSARAQDHGASAVELVSALRSQSADIRAKYFFGEAEGLREGDTAYLSRTRCSELH